MKIKSFNGATGNGLFRGFLFYAVLALSFAMGASAQPGIKTDIVFVLVPAEAKPTINTMDSLSPSNRYVDGCRIVRLSPSDNGGAPIPLTTEFLSARDPEVSFDGKTILFAGKRQNGEPWGIWRMDTDGGNKVRVTMTATQGMEDAVSPLYVGSLFHLDDKSPTRKILYQGKEGKLYTCDLDGKDRRRITFNVYPEFEPDVLPNGRVIFSSVKEDGNEKVLDLLAINIDGTDLMDYVTGPRVPGNKEMVRVGRDGRVYFIESDGDGWLRGGTLSYVSQRRPVYSYNVLARGGGEGGFFHSPCPLPDGGLVVSFREGKEGALYGLFTLDPGTGKREKLIYTAPGYHCVDAHVLAPRPMVKGRSSFVDDNRETGVFYCIDVYISERPEVKRLARGSITGVRVLEGTGPGVRVLGTAPVERDGSFHIEVPAETPLAFELLDKDGGVVSRQSTWTWVMGRESRGCIGCHEDRELSPPNRLPEAIVKPAVKLTRVKEKGNE